MIGSDLLSQLFEMQLRLVLILRPFWSAILIDLAPVTILR